MAAEAAVHRDAEFRQVSGSRGVASFQPGHAVEWEHDPQEHARVPRPQVSQRAKEAVVLATEIPGTGQVQPVHRPARVGDGLIGHLDDQAHVARLVHRPLRKRPVAEVISDQDVCGDLTGEPRDRAGEALPGAVSRPRQHPLDVEHLVADIPLDGEVLRRDLRGQPRELAAHELLEAALAHWVVAHRRGAGARSQPADQRLPPVGVDPESVAGVHQGRVRRPVTGARVEPAVRVVERPGTPVRGDRGIGSRP